jgi:hypothetical protein
MPMMTTRARAMIPAIVIGLRSSRVVWVSG